MRSPRESKTNKSKIFDEAYFKGKRGSYEKEGYNFKRRYSAFLPLAKTFHKMSVRKALDVGCATGPLVKAFLDLGIEAYGVDVSEWAVKNSPVSERILWLDIDEESVPFTDNQFDLITMNFVIEHLYRPEKALREALRLLKRGGYLYIVTDKPSLDFSKQVGHVNVKSKKEWMRILKSMNYKTSIVLYLKFALLYQYEQARGEYGPIARKFLLHKIPIFGFIIRFISKIILFFNI